MAQLIGESSASISTNRDDGMGAFLEPKHKVFLSYSGAETTFVEQLCVDLERCNRYPFFDRHDMALRVGEDFPKFIFDAIGQCDVGVVILSEEFLTSKWPMMELVAMVEEAEKRKSSFKILPVFLRISIKEFENPMIHMRWQSCWHELASKDKNRKAKYGVEDEKLNVAFKHLRYLNGLVYDGFSEVSCRRVVVDAICQIVPPHIIFDDSHLQGRLRMCKEIRDKIDVHRKDRNDGVCVIGLYGKGGTGKTSICKVLCNEFSTEFRGRVCHAELGSVSNHELLRQVLKTLSNIGHEVLDTMNPSELHDVLRQGNIKEAVFLALDNMVDSIASSNEVEFYLSARLPPGSIVLVTARAKDSLKLARPYLDENNCMPMPELTIEEAVSLFIESSGLEWRNDSDNDLIRHFVERCQFSKDYHPLALKLLGRQWLSIDRNDRKKLVHKEYVDPIFSILRASFDSLSSEDQLLFMDVALFLPIESQIYPRANFVNADFQWLGMVHGISHIDVMRALKRLERKSLLRLVDDGVETRIVMHDLWREFCVAEINVGNLERRRCVYEVDKCGKLVGTSQFGSYWANVERMVNSSGLRWQLKSLQLENLRILHLEGCRQLHSCHAVGGLEALERLTISCANLEELPNLQKLKKLRVLDVSKCSLITELSGLGDLVALEELKASQCLRLSKLPDVLKLSKLRVLDLRGSPLEKFQVALTLLRKVLSLVSSIVDMSAQAKFYHRQCEYIEQRSLEASKEIHALFGGSEMSLEQWSVDPLVRSLNSLVGCMGKGMNLLQLCGDDCDQVALTLSFLAPHKDSFSQFALVIRDLDWHLDVFHFLLDNPRAGFAQWQAQGSKFFWCEERFRIVYARDGENEAAHPDCVNAYLRADIERHVHGRNHQVEHLVVSESILLKQIGYLDKLRSCSASSSNRSQGDSDFSDNSNPLLGCFWIQGKLEYKPISVLGKGSSKVVLKCEWLGKKVAIAELDWPRKSLEAEVGLLARVQHPNVVNLIGCSYDEEEKKGFIMTELMETNLRKAIDSRKVPKEIDSRKLPGREFPFDLLVSIDIILQIAEAMVHVHECEVIYRDLKAENCLVNRKGDGYVVKLTDFGESKLWCSERGSNCSTSNRGTRAWMAPEVMGNGNVKYNRSADVYSFGLTCYEILTGKIPFDGMEPRELKKKVRENHRPEIPSDCPEGLAELMRKCWATRPEDRPNFKEIRQSLWKCKLCCTILNTVPIMYGAHQQSLLAGFRSCFPCAFLWGCC